jgi:hypothetical protein
MSTTFEGSAMNEEKVYEEDGHDISRMPLPVIP